VEQFQSSNLSGEQDSSVAKLLRERSSIAQSMRSINDVINQAFETKNSLTGQRHTLGGAAGGLKGLVANVPVFNRLLDGIQKKKSREQIVVSIVVGSLIIFTLWYLFLR
jgi:Golgi SNAP receptor complex protein 1